MSDDNEQTKVLKEILKWIKVSGIKDVKPVLEEEFKENVKKQIYQLSDGTKGTQEIAKIVNDVTYTTVFRYWKSWEKLGLGEYITIPGGKRFQRSFDLEDFGLKVLEIKTNSKQSQSEVEDTNIQSTEKEVQQNDN